MLPGHWGGVGEQLGRHRLAGGAQMRECICQVGRVPVDDRGDDKIQAGGPELLCLCAALGDPSLAKRANHLGQRMSLFTLVQAGVAVLAQIGAFEPVEHE